MVKKINSFGATVKTLLSKGYSQIWIARRLGVTKQRVNYWAKNPLRIKSLKKKEIIRLKKEIKNVKKEANKKIKNNKKEKIKKKKILDIEEIKKEIEKIEKMNIIDYLNYTKEIEKKRKQKNNLNEERDEESTMNESMNTILKIKELNKKNNCGIKYEIEF